MYLKVYLLLAHKKPEQLQQLITLLQDGRSIFFVHVDKKVAINQFNALSQLDVCFFVRQREAGRWGGFGIVQGTLNGMNEIKDYMKQNYPSCQYHCIVLSGEDMPVKNNTYIHDYLKNKQDFSFLNHWSLPYANWWDGGLFRFKSLYCFDYTKHRQLNQWLNTFVKKFRLTFLLPLNRLKSVYPNLKLFGSSQWMILSKSHMEMLCEETKDFKKLRQIFKTVLLPDETFLVTYSYNFLNLGKDVLKNVKTHLIIFKGDKNNPEYLSVSEIETFQDENTLFARKFDSMKNGEALNYLLNKLNP